MGRFYLIHRPQVHRGVASANHGRDDVALSAEDFSPLHPLPPPAGDSFQLRATIHHPQSAIHHNLWPLAHSPLPFIHPPFTKNIHPLPPPAGDIFSYELLSTIHHPLFTITYRPSPIAHCLLSTHSLPPGRPAPRGQGCGWCGRRTGGCRRRPVCAGHGKALRAWRPEFWPVRAA